MEETAYQLEVEEMPENEVNRLIKIGFKGYTNKKLVKSKVGGIILSARYANMAKKIRTFEFRSDDIIVMTYPKSGTTWLQETLWSMRHSHELHLAEKESISQRTYFIDADGLYSLDHQMSMKPQLNRFRSLCPGKNPEDGIVMQLAAASNTPRVIKTHLPLSVYPRSLLDVCKSLYTLCIKSRGCSASIEIKLFSRKRQS
ncbi:hypothetical protein SK128_024222 [Halocaridina rubra]|uniref:Sulfotransferase domain-containing protein n=1 Tax=Halocaridina rubra TaxID=373956 RepID=A0AAN8X9E7_HALRR